jgi:hypothetical protein
MARETEATIDKLRAEVERRNAEIQKQQAEVAELHRQIETWEGILAGLRFIGNPEAEMPLPRRMDLEGLGFKDAVLTVVYRSPMAMTPVEIREIMMMSGLAGTSPKNLLIQIHNALERADEIEKVNGPDGKPVYRFMEGKRELWASFHNFKVAHDRRASRNLRTPLETAMQLSATPTGKKK